ncbi:hypothetical protein FRC15_002891, partial [Serendipita sp. 397]
PSDSDNLGSLMVTVRLGYFSGPADSSLSELGSSSAKQSVTMDETPRTGCPAAMAVRSCSGSQVPIFIKGRGAAQQLPICDAMAPLSTSHALSS